MQWCESVQILERGVGGSDGEMWEGGEVEGVDFQTEFSGERGDGERRCGCCWF